MASLSQNERASADAYFIETQNIDLFKSRLKTETDSDKRRILLLLLADEEAKLAAHRD
jgi:hypothetical protein